ncbi:MAG: DUF4175 family protein, partial [Flavobacteriales bacterium]|nr:DUF4175 family protein [Flavobacteriales bacterium]
MKPGISLIEKLDDFIRRYHRNKALRGALLSFATLTLGALLLAALENVSRFGVAGRTVLFYAFAATTLAVLATQVVWPMLQWFRLSGGLSYDQAARIVGEHFPEVKDKLLNTLQLQQQVDNAQGADVTLLAASIDQRTSSLRPLPFAQAVDVGPAMTALRMALPVAVVVGALVWLKPTWVTEPATRIVQHRTEFVEPAPFRFELRNESLKVAAGDALTLEVEVVGNELPSAVMVEAQGGRFRMERAHDHIFRYTFPSVRSSTPFRFLANGWRSDEFVAVPFAMPSLAELRVEATPPRYTGLPAIDQRNQGDLTVPEGTPIQWSIRVANGDGVTMRLADNPLDVRAGAANTYLANWVASSNTVYWVTPTGVDAIGDSLRHRIRVIRDGKPSIRVSEEQDSTSRKRRHFTGAIQDDYGFSRLTFAWAFVERASRQRLDEPLFAGDAPSVETDGRVELDVPTGRQGTFFHTWNMGELDWREGDVLECWFEAWDNDGVHGAKMARSGTTRIAAPSQEEIREERNETADSIEENLEEASREAAELREAMEAMQERLREQGEMTWQDRQAMEDLMEQQKSLQEKLEQMREENERKDGRANEFNKQEERILDKQKQLQKLMDNIMSEELRQIYEQMEELMQEMDPEKMQEQLNEMELNHDAMEKELDRALEQFRQLEWETKMDEAID